jgi:hypothetical protein
MSCAQAGASPTLRAAFCLLSLTSLQPNMKNSLMHLNPAVDSAEIRELPRGAPKNGRQRLNDLLALLVSGGRPTLSRLFSQRHLSSAFVVRRKESHPSPQCLVCQLHSGLVPCCRL